MKFVLTFSFIEKISRNDSFRKTKTYLPPRFMTVSQAAQQILESAKQLQVEDGEYRRTWINFLHRKILKSTRIRCYHCHLISIVLVINDKTICIGAARIGWTDEKFLTTTLRRMADDVDLGKPLHSLVIVGQLHPLEIDYLKIHSIESSFDQLTVENNQSLTN